MHVPIMGFRKIFSIHSFVNGSFRCNSREGQVMGDSIFLDDLPRSLMLAWRDSPNRDISRFGISMACIIRGKVLVVMTVLNNIMS